MTDLMVDAKVAPRSKFTTIYSGMEVQPFVESDSHRAAMREKLGFEEQHVVIGKIARLFHLKGHEYLIEAAKLIPPRNRIFVFFWLAMGYCVNNSRRRSNAVACSIALFSPG